MAAGLGGRVGAWRAGWRDVGVDPAPVSSAGGSQSQLAGWSWWGSPTKP